VYAGDYSDALDAIDARGQVPVPQGPGLGVGIDWDYVRRRQVAAVVYE
jgi:L-alanine-DL-glutamate epimerase-like enolase superfamily enzyme